MSFKRILFLMEKDFRHNLMGFFLIFSVVGPLLLTLLVHLVFGSIFSGKPKLGISFKHPSPIIKSISAIHYLEVKIYPSEEELKTAIRRGANDIGVAFADDFDQNIQSGKLVKLTAYIWGESHLKNRAIISAAILHEIRAIVGRENPIDIHLVAIGHKQNIPWKDRFLALIVLLAIFISGFTIPASLMVEEKLKRTYGAIITTPLTRMEYFVAKGLLGVLLSIAMGIVVLLVNGAFIGHFGLIVFILFLGAIMAACFGLIVGTFVQEMATLHTVIKGLGLFIYGPAIVAIFPQIPSWIAKMFPTYYVMNPLLEICLHQADWLDILNEIIILLILLGILIALTGIIARKIPQQKD